MKKSVFRIESKHSLDRVSSTIVAAGGRAGDSVSMSEMGIEAVPIHFDVHDRIGFGSGYVADRDLVRGDLNGSLSDACAYAAAYD